MCGYLFRLLGKRDDFLEVFDRLEAVADSHPRFMDLIPLALYEVCRLMKVTDLFY